MLTISCLIDFEVTWDLQNMWLEGLVMKRIKIASSKYAYSRLINATIFEKKGMLCIN